VEVAPEEFEGHSSIYVSIKLFGVAYDKDAFRLAGFNTSLTQDLTVFVLAGSFNDPGPTVRLQLAHSAN